MAIFLCSTAHRGRWLDRIRARRGSYSSGIVTRISRPLRSSRPLRLRLAAGGFLARGRLALLRGRLLGLLGRSRALLLQFLEKIDGHPQFSAEPVYLRSAHLNLAERIE